MALKWRLNLAEKLSAKFQGNFSDSGARFECVMVFAEDVSRCQMAFAEGNRGVIVLAMGAVTVIAYLLSGTFEKDSRRDATDRNVTSQAKNEIEQLLPAHQAKESHPSTRTEPGSTNPELPQPKRPSVLGRWTVVKFEMHGTVQDKVKQEGEIIVDDNTLSLVTPGKQSPTNLRCKFDHEDIPPSFVCFNNDGDTAILRGIYKVTDDELILCMTPAKFGWPKEFKTRWGNEGIMFTATRTK